MLTIFWPWFSWSATKSVEAIAELQKVLQFQPSHWEAQHQLGLAQLQNNNPSAAVESLRRCLAAKPSSVPAHYNLGLALGQLGELEKAIAEFKRTID